MLTQEDIDDLKKYTEQFNNFCSSRICSEECEVFQRSTSKGMSCWKSFVEIQKEKESSAK